MRLLLVEDHESLGASLQKALVDHTFVVDWVTCAEEAAAAMSVASYDLLLLDLGLPDRSGLEYLKELRRGGHSLPVLVLTARGGPE